MQWAGPEPAARAGGSGRRRFDAGAAGDENEKAVGRSASAGQHGASGEHLPPHMGQELWRRRRDQDTRRRRRRRQGEVVGAQQRVGGGKRRFDPLLGRMGWSLRWAGRCGDVNHTLQHLSGNPPPPTSYRLPQTRKLPLPPPPPRVAQTGILLARAVATQATPWETRLLIRVCQDFDVEHPPTSPVLTSAVKRSRRPPA